MTNLHRGPKKSGTGGCEGVTTAMYRFALEFVDFSGLLGSLFLSNAGTNCHGTTSVDVHPPSLPTYPFSLPKPSLSTRTVPPLNAAALMSLALLVLAWEPRVGMR